MEALVRDVIQNNSSTLIFVAILSLLALIKTSYYNRFIDFLWLPVNNKYLMVYSKEQTLRHPFTLLMSLVQILITAKFITLVIPVFEFSFWQKIEHSYFVIAGVLLLLLGSKILLQKIIANLFNIDALVDQYIFKKISYLNHSSLLLLVFSVLFTYSIDASKTSIIVIFLLFLMLNVTGWFLLLKNHRELIFSKLFYFILYLCALEIAPYLIGYKLLSN